jgi:hypothetical protein
LSFLRIAASAFSINTRFARLALKIKTAAVEWVSLYTYATDSGVAAFFIATYLNRTTLDASTSTK